MVFNARAWITYNTATCMVTRSFISPAVSNMAFTEDVRCPSFHTPQFLDHFECANSTLPFTYFSWWIHPRTQNVKSSLQGWAIRNYVRCQFTAFPHHHVLICYVKCPWPRHWQKVLNLIPRHWTVAAHRSSEEDGKKCKGHFIDICKPLHIVLSTFG